MSALDRENRLGLRVAEAEAENRTLRRTLADTRVALARALDDLADARAVIDPGPEPDDPDDRILWLVTAGPSVLGYRARVLDLEERADTAEAIARRLEAELAACPARQYHEAYPYRGGTE